MELAPFLSKERKWEPLHFLTWSAERKSAPNIAEHLMLCKKVS